MEATHTTKDSKLFLVVMAIQILAVSLSNLFVNVFFWNMQHSLTVLALYSLTYSVGVLVSFPIAATISRRTNAMWCMRAGIVLHIFAYGLVIVLRANSLQYIEVIGAILGLAVSFFVVGQHLQTLDITQNETRDRFLFTGSILNNAASLLGPVVGGLIIVRIVGLTGYYVVFSLSVLWFCIEFLMSFGIRSSQIHPRSHLRQVWTHPTKEWRHMFWVTMGGAMVEGTYSTFLVTIMMYTVLQNDLSLGWYKTIASLLTILSSLYFARKSSPKLRLPLYVVGGVLVSLSSVILSIHQDFVVLVLYILLSSVGLNLVGTMLDSWSYASIELDPEYKERRLDYIVIREVPLGIGRIVGVSLFLLLQQFFQSYTLVITFALFGSVYLLLIPGLARIWRKPSTTISWDDGTSME